MKKYIKVPIRCSREYDMDSDSRMYYEVERVKEALEPLRNHLDDLMVDSYAALNPSDYKNAMELRQAVKDFSKELNMYY